jgi:hypothetical protein
LGAIFRNGTNFAIGRSTVTQGGSPFLLDVQFHQFLYLRARCVELINLDQKPLIDRRAIYPVDIGQNDLSAFMHLPYHQVLTKVPDVVAQIRYTVDTHRF